MTRWTMLGSIPFLALAAACGSNDSDSDATGGAGGSGGESGSAGEAGAAGASGSDGGPSCEGTQSTDEKFSQALQVLRDELVKADVPGAAIAIVKDGKLVDVGVTGSKLRGACDPIAPETLFRTAALTQAITSIAVLDAEEDGEISRTDRVVDLVPNLPRPSLSNGSVDDITIHHLLSQSSMYTPELNGGPGNVSADCSDTALANTTGAVLYATPGSMYHGLWTDFDLAGLALENAEGRPFIDVVGDRVLGPLGMGGAFDLATVLASDHASPSDPTESCPNKYPSDGYHGSIRDVAKLAEYLTGGGAAQILDPPGLDAMLSEQGPAFESYLHISYGSAVFRAEAVGDAEITIGSWSGGFAQDVTIWKQRRLAVIVLVNEGGFAPWNAAKTVGFEVGKIYDPSLEADGSSWRTYDSPPTPASRGDAMTALGERRGESQAERPPRIGSAQVS